MKTLKFRAWHKTKKKMFEVKCIEFGSCVWSKDGNWFVPISEVEIMQFTGLLDRHGKEIYEGDVVLATLKYFDIRNEKCKVIFHDGAFGVQFGFSTDYFKPLIAIAWDDIEIIGTIHDQKAEV